MKFITNRQERITIKSMYLKGYLYILIAAILWGLIGPVSKFALASGTSALEIAFFRALLSWFFFAGHAAYTRKVKIHAKDIPLFAVFGLAGISLFYSSYFIAVEKGGAAFASVLLYTAPAWVAVIAPIVYNEAVTVRKTIAVVLTITGAIAICLGGVNGADLNVSPVAVIAGLTAGFTYSLYYIFGKYFTSRYDSSTLFLYIMPIGVLGLLPITDFTSKSWQEWAAMIFIAFFCSYAANSFYYKGLKYLEPTQAVLTATLEPVIACVFAWLIWKELFSWAGFAGAALILSGVALCITDGKPSD